VGPHASVLTAILADLQQVKEEHNRACHEMATIRGSAADKVKAHFAARYLLDPGAVDTREALKQASVTLDRIEKIGLKIKGQSEGAHAELQRSSVAATQINDLLKRLLGPRISVEEAPDKRIRFIRDGQPATNMSDGERTAVSLAYFLASL